MKGSVAVGAGIVGAGTLALGGDDSSTLDRLFGPSAAHAASNKGGLDAHVPPGKLDAYYGFWSGGQSGEIRIMGVPSMREFKRIPVVCRDAATGWVATIGRNSCSVDSIPATPTTYTFPIRTGPTTDATST